MTDETNPGPVEKHLRAMRALLSDESKWTQHAAAKSVTGDQAMPDGNSAVRWCLEGASVRCGGDVNGPWTDILCSAAPSCDRDDVAWWNDTPGRTFAEVADALDRSIALAHERGV